MKFFFDDSNSYYNFFYIADRNVIQWDLNEMREVNVFGNHPNNVVSVKYDPSRKIMYSVSNSFVKIWDTRDNKCIKTLT